METTRQQNNWLPKLNRSLAPRLNSLLQPGSLTEDEESVEMLARAVLEDALQTRSTDVHFEPFSKGWRVRVRVDGFIHDAAQLAPEPGQRLVRYFRTTAKLDPVITYVPEDASLQFEIQGRRLDLRLATAPCFGGEKLALRLLDPKRLQHSIHDLGLEEENVERLAQSLSQVAGMCLITGPTGSGKTTTLYALLHELELSDNIVITIEDPVEYPIDGIAQIQVNPAHGLTFASGLRAMLRLDPDYLLVGEMRDVESAQVAIEAAASGHFVMSTLHSPDAAGVITLLRNWHISDHQIATVLQTVVNQRLLRRLCPKCRRSGKPTALDRTWLNSLRLTMPSQVWQPVGCDDCRETGYRGRIGVFEVWHKDESDYCLLLDHADEHSLRAHLRQRGLNTVLEDGLKKLAKGVTSLDEIQRIGTHIGYQPAPTRSARPKRRAARPSQSTRARKRNKK